MVVVVSRSLLEEGDSQCFLDGSIVLKKLYIVEIVYSRSSLASISMSYAMHCHIALESVPPPNGI